MSMRTLLYLCFAAGLAAGEAPKPGVNQAFLARLLADSEGGARPWKTFRVPEASASAMVEVVGEYTPAEIRQMAFQEFLVWFREDLRRFWSHRGAAAATWASSAVPASSHGGNPMPEAVPLLRMGF